MKKFLFLGFIAWLSQSLIGSHQLPKDILSRISANHLSLRQQSAPTVVVQLITHNIVMQQSLNGGVAIWKIYSAMPNGNLYRSLIEFCVQRKINELKDLLSKEEIHPDQIRLDEGGKTLIMRAMAHKQYDVLKILLEEGKADPDIKDKVGQAAIIYAVRDEDQEAVDLLLQARANVNIATPGDTALMAAVSTKNKKIIAKLLSAKADPNLQDKIIGATALMAAVCENQDEIVAMLLKAHADPEIIAESGKSALAFAMENKNEFILKMLQDAMIPGLSDSEEDV